MVRWFELSVLWPVALASLLTYQATCFVLLRRRLRGDRRVSREKQIHRVVSLSFTMIVIMQFIFIFAMFSRGDFPPGAFWELLPPVTTLWGVLLFSYSVLLVATTTLASLYCCRHFEVNA